MNALIYLWRENKHVPTWPSAKYGNWSLTRDQPLTAPTQPSELPCPRATGKWTGRGKSQSELGLGSERGPRCRAPESVLAGACKAAPSARENRHRCWNLGSSRLTRQRSQGLRELRRSVGITLLPEESGKMAESHPRS